MKPIFLLLLAGPLAFTVIARANAQSGRPVAKATRTVTIIGVVTTDEKNLITRQKQVLAVVNPEALRDHAGQRVSVIADIRANDTMSVEAIRVLTPKYPCCP